MEEAIHVTDRAGNLVLDASGQKIKSIFRREVDYLTSMGYELGTNGTAVKVR